MVFVGVGYGSILYFRVKSQNDLYSWNTVQTFIEENFMMVRKSKDCRTITHVDVDDEGVLWALESNIQDFIANRVGCFGPSMLLTSVLEPPTPISDEHDKRKVSSRKNYVKYFWYRHLRWVKEGRGKCQIVRNYVFQKTSSYRWKTNFNKFILFVLNVLLLKIPSLIKFIIHFITCI